MLASNCNAIIPVKQSVHNASPCHNPLIFMVTGRVAEKEKGIFECFFFGFQDMKFGCSGFTAWPISRKHSFLWNYGISTVAENSSKKQMYSRCPVVYKAYCTLPGKPCAVITWIRHHRDLIYSLKLSGLKENISDTSRLDCITYKHTRVSIKF